MCRCQSKTAQLAVREVGGTDRGASRPLRPGQGLKAGATPSARENTLVGSRVQRDIDSKMRAILETLRLGLAASLLLGGPPQAAGRALEKTARLGGVKAADSGWTQPLDSDAKVSQLLNRITFGPRSGDVERVRRMGISTFLEQQLHPESLTDSATEAKVASLPTLFMSSKVLAENFQEMMQERRAKQADVPATPANSSPAGQGSPNSVETTQGEPQGGPQDKIEMLGPRRAVMELAQEELLRAVYSNRQLQEVMVQFWMNHFNIFADKGADRWLVTSFERDTIWPHALGKFEDLLVATAESPAMLFYLDNWLSAKAGYVTRSTGNNHGLNENYARGLMELHTLGVDGGYTQSDVIAVARCFTGWTIHRPQQGGEFLFNPRMHDTATKVVLGHKIRAGKGLEDGLAVLHILAHHPSTARFIALKLCRRFISDDPPPSVVESASRAFLKSDGDLRVVLKTILSSPEFYSEAAYRAKVKSPLELVASSMRGLGVDTDASVLLIQMVARMGQPMFEYQAPTGFPDRATTWINSGTLLTRMNFAFALALNRFPGTAVDWAQLWPATEDLSPEAVLEKLNQQLLQGSLTQQTRESILRQLRDPKPQAAHQGDGQSSGGLLRQPVRNATLEASGWGVAAEGKAGRSPVIAAFVLASPEFQRR
jgi:uncharacterized protein (DUF1800 family)